MQAEAEAAATAATAPGDPGERGPLGAVTGTPRIWLRIEGAAALLGAVGLYLQLGGQILWLAPLLLAVDASMAGYLAGPRVGAFVYNLFHNWAIGVVVLAIAWWLDSAPVALIGAILLAHVGMDRAAGYGLKYPTSFGDTHLGRIGRAAR